MLKFARDRRRLQWLFEAKRRYGLVVLNYMATSNHIHLLVVDDGGLDVIPKSMQLIAGRTGQEYNQRKSREGYELREPQAPYGDDFDVKNGVLRLGNTYSWKVSPDISRR